MEVIPPTIRIKIEKSLKSLKPSNYEAVCAGLVPWQAAFFCSRIFPPSRPLFQTNPYSSAYDTFDIDFALYEIDG